jgi:hypothetical protein
MPPQPPKNLFFFPNPNNPWPNINEAELAPNNVGRIKLDIQSYVFEDFFYACAFLVSWLGS